MSARIGGFHAYRLGLGALRRNGPLWFFAVSSEAALAACGQALLLAGAFAFIESLARGLGEAADLDGALSGRLWLPLFGLWLALAAIAAVVRLTYLGAAVVDASEALQLPDRRPEPVIIAGARVFGRALSATLWLALIELIAGLFRAVLLGTALVMVFARGGHGAGWAAPAALAITIAFLVALMAELFGRVYLVQAIRHVEISALAAAWEAGRSLLARLGTYLLITVIAVALGIAGSMVSGSIDALPMEGHLVLGRALALLAAAVAAGWRGAVELATIGALCAVDLDQRGELPRPPPPPEPVQEAKAVEQAEEVLVAEVIEPKPTS